MGWFVEVIALYFGENVEAETLGKSNPK